MMAPAVHLSTATQHFKQGAPTEPWVHAIVVVYRRWGEVLAPGAMMSASRSAVAAGLGRASAATPLTPRAPACAMQLVGQQPEINLSQQTHYGAT
jgi:hypothetical protein